MKRSESGALASGIAPNRRLVVSAVNLVEGGTLTVLIDCLKACSECLPPDWEVVALVHDPALVGVAGVQYVSYPLIKSSWLRRIYFEYFECRKISRELRADVWLALHDMTPCVEAPVQAVYCHNPMPFYRMSAREVRHAPKLLLFSLFYGFLYGLNIGRNRFVIVQQEWIRNLFKRRYRLRNVIVARPIGRAPSPRSPLPQALHHFVYPSLPRVFKNFEVIGEAVKILERSGEWKGQVSVTIDGTENSYAREIRSRFHSLRSLRFIGRQSRTEMEGLYSTADCLLFPSRLETWGLPLSEAMDRGLPVLAADRPYAHETLAGYDRAAFFAADAPHRLAELMRLAHQGRLSFAPSVPLKAGEPYAPDWPALLRRLIG